MSGTKPLTREATVKLIIAMFLIILFSMLCIFLGWNFGFAPVLASGVKTASFGNTFFMGLFIFGASIPLGAFMRSSK